MIRFSFFFFWKRQWNWGKYEEILRSNKVETLKLRIWSINLLFRVRLMSHITKYRESSFMRVCMLLSSHVKKQDHKLICGVLHGCNTYKWKVGTTGPPVFLSLQEIDKLQMKMDCIYAYASSLTINQSTTFTFLCLYHIVLPIVCH